MQRIGLFRMMGEDLAIERFGLGQMAGQMFLPGESEGLIEGELLGLCECHSWLSVSGRIVPENDEGEMRMGKIGREKPALGGFVVQILCI
jgi:hypothetical protein